MTFQYQKRDQAQIQVPRGCPKLKSLRLAQALQHSARLRLAEKITKLFFFIRKTGASEQNDIEEEKNIWNICQKRNPPFSLKFKACRNVFRWDDERDKEFFFGFLSVVGSYT